LVLLRNTGAAYEVVAEDAHALAQDVIIYLVDRTGDDGRSWTSSWRSVGAVSDIGSCLVF
jgi:hypothetical protein